MSSFRAFEIEVRALGPLLVGGQSAPAHGGDKASARDAQDRSVIPASALRGALRIELERLLRGRDGENAVCGANPEAGVTRGEDCDCAVCRLFGAEGYGIGTLRLEDGKLDDASVVAPVLRPQVAVGRRSGSAVAKHLVFLEPSTSTSEQTPVYRARGHLAPRTAEEGPEALEQDLRNLSAACAALSGLGGGKARGLGWVECVLRAQEETKVPARPLAVAPLAASDTVDLRIRVEARAALHFGDGRPLGGFLPTRTSAAGSTVRGAVAFALLEQGLARPDEQRFQRLMAGPGGSASFGSARVAADRPSQTRRRCRANDHVFDDLVGELLRREAAAVGVGLSPRAGAACPEPGCPATKAQPWPWRKGHPEPWRRVRTHTAINRRTGTAMDQKLFSVEVLESTYPGEQAESLELVADVRGLTAEAAELLAALDGREVWLGGRRSRGMGRCLLRMEQAPQSSLDEARQAIDDLTNAVRLGWEGVHAAAIGVPEALIGDDEALLAIALEEPWAPENSQEALHGGPLAFGTERAGPILQPVHRFLALVEEGRFGALEAARFGAPESVGRGELQPHLAAAPGTIYVYRVNRASMESDLPRWIAVGRRGSGLNQELGWGRFSIRGPALDD